MVETKYNYYETDLFTNAWTFLFVVVMIQLTD